MERIGAPVLLLLVGLLAHWPSGAGFKADDYAVVVYASDWAHVLHDWWGPQYDLRFFLFYRPVITTSLAVDHAAFGIEPFGYLFMNMLACIAAALLIRAVVIEMWAGRRGRLFGSLLGLLWLLQPALVYTVRWVVGRVDTHVVPPMLAAVWLFLRARRGRGAMWPAWLLAWIALFAKEYAIGLPLLMLGLDLLHPEAAQRGYRLGGRRLPSLPFLLIIPGYFLFRYLVLGSFVGGYFFQEGQTLELARRAAGLWFFLGHGFVPVAAQPLRVVITLVPLVFAGYWILSGRSGRLQRAGGLLFTLAGIWGPLAILLLRVGESVQLRYAYLACIWMVALWLGFAFAIGSRSRGLTLAIGLLPLGWMLPAWIEARLTMDGHDAFNVEILAALDEGDRRTTDPEAPLMLMDEAGAAHDVYRLLWGLGVIMKPPFHETGREVVSLRSVMPWVDAVPRTFFDDDIAGGVTILEDSGVWVSTRNPGRAIPVRAQGFDGVLRAADLDRFVRELQEGRIEEESSLGYEAGAEHDGRVAVVTSMGSFLIRVPSVDGRLRLVDLLLANAMVDPAFDVPVSAVWLLWIAFDLAKDSPVYFFWRAADGLRRAELRPGPKLPDAVWRLMRPR